MCVTHVKTYVYPDGGRETFERQEYCPRSDGHNPCGLNTRRKYPDQVITSTSAVASPSLVDDDVTTPSSGSFPSTPSSVTSAPRIETREPRSSAKEKAKGPRRTINFQDLRFQSPKGRKEGNRRKNEPSPRARFADDERVIIDGSDATVRPTTPTRRGRRDTPSPSILRSPAPTAHGSPNPRMKHASAEVHQVNPPSTSRDEALRPRQSSHRRNLTEPTEITSSSSSRADSTDADLYTRPDYRARARETHQRQERERRREEDEDRKRQQEAREKAEDEHSLREYHRINAREDMRRAHQRRLAEADELEERVKALQERAKERQEQEQVERIVREVRERREKLRDTVRREAEEVRVQDGSRHDAERRRDRRLQEAVSQIPRRSDEAGYTADDIQRLTNNIELDRESRRHREREEELLEERRKELRLEQEIHRLEESLRHPSDAQTGPEQQHNTSQQHNTTHGWQPHHNSWPQHNGWTQYTGWPQYNGWPHYNGWHQRNSWHDNYYPPFDYRRMIGQAYNPPSPPTPHSAGWPSSGSSGPIQTRSPFEDPNYRRARGERVLQQERAFANARDRAIDMQQAVNNPGGLYRRNSSGGGGRERELTYRTRYPWLGL